MRQALSTRDGLLYVNNEVIPFPKSDTIALDHGYNSTAQLVRALVKRKKLREKSSHQKRIR